MRSLQGFVVLATIVLVAWVPSLARAGCTKDSECKGDRICVEERCVDPPEATPSTGDSGIAEVDLRFARGRRGIAHRNLHGTWVLFGFQAAGALSYGGWLVPLVGKGGVDDDSIGSFVTLGVVTVFGGITPPLASIGGNQARQGLERLGLDPVETGLRRPGLALYGVSMGFLGGAYGSIIGLAANDRDCFALDPSERDACEQAETTGARVLVGMYAGLGVTSAITGVISTVLLQADTARQRRALLNALDDASAGRLSRAAPRVRLIGVAPWFETRADQTGGGVSFTGSF